MARAKSAAKRQVQAQDEPEGVVVVSAHEGRVGLWDTNPKHEKFDHEDGEIFVKDKPVRVALTAEVAAALKAGNLVETREEPEKKEES